MSEDIRQIYNQDIKEKKRSGRSAHNRTGKHGRGGSKVTTPADLLTGAEKRNYTKPSPVTTSNIYYDQIMSLEEFKSLSKNRKMLVLDAYKRRYTASEIASEWQLSPKSVYYYYKAYGVTKSRKAAERENQPASHQPAEDKAAVENTAVESKATAEAEPSGRPKRECSFMAVGEFGAGSLGKKLQGLSYILNDNLRYQVEIHIKEIPRQA